MNLKTAVLILAISLSTSNENLACSCSNVPETFAQHIKANHIILKATVVKQIPIPLDSNSVFIYQSLTQLEVQHWYQNQMESDTIYYANGQGAMCTSSIAHLSIGSMIIVKAQREYLHDHSKLYGYPDSNYSRFVKDYHQNPIVGYSICDLSLLHVEENQVIGPTTKNYLRRKMKWERFVGKINKSWAIKIRDKRQNNPTKHQMMTLEKFARIMTMKWNSLRYS